MLTDPPPRPLLPEAQHDPSAALARLVRARDPRCDGPGCSVPAARSELDHDDPWPAGPTGPANLRPRSQRCHHAKHHGWTTSTAATATAGTTGTTATGTQTAATTWTSPGGRRYRVPSRRLRFDPVPGLHVRLRALAA